MYKRRLNSLKKLETKEISISTKYIFNVPSKSTSFKEKFSLHTFKNHDHAYRTPKGLSSHDKIHESTFTQATKH